MNVGTVILSGVVGSRAYNLDSEGSDVDVRGIFLQPVKSFFSFDGFNDVVNGPGDLVYYELQKFIHLALKGNPAFLEMLFLSEYLILNEFGKLLIENRKSFLSDVVRHTYSGYAKSQFKQAIVLDVDSEKYKKKIRHVFRLIRQGTNLLRTGNINVCLTDVERAEFFTLCEFGVDKVSLIFEREYSKLQDADSILSREPDYDTVDQVVFKIRDL